MPIGPKPPRLSSTPRRLKEDDTPPTPRYWWRHKSLRPATAMPANMVTVAKFMVPLHDVVLHGFDVRLGFVAECLDTSVGFQAKLLNIRFGFQFQRLDIGADRGDLGLGFLSQGFDIGLGREP